MTDLLRALIETRSAVLLDADSKPGGRDLLLVRSDLTGTRQLYELEGAGDGGGGGNGGGGNGRGGSALRALTDLTEPVGAGAFVPGRRQVLLEVDRGGDERHQIYRLELDRDAPARDDELEALTSDHSYGHHLAGVSPDGSKVAYVSNRANGVDFDLWLCDLTDGSHRLLYASGAWCQPGSGFSPGGRWVSVLRPGPRPLDMDLVLVELDSAKALTVLAHPDEAASVGPPAWVDDTTFYVSSNVGRDRAAVVRCDLGDEPSDSLPGFRAGAGDWDAEVLTSPDGKVLLVVENHNGANRLSLIDPSSGGEPVVVGLGEEGVVSHHRIPPPRFSHDGRRLYYSYSTPRRPADVWVYDRDTTKTSQLTESPAAAPPGELVPVEMAEVESFDGEHLPLFVLRPAAPAPALATSSSPATTAGPAAPPVVVIVHGGPEAQAMLVFDPIAQALALAGYAVVIPNVRGSTGYGKRYASLDDTTRRLDSVRDLAAIRDWLAGAGLDSGRAGLFGGSYGGYMVLAGLAFQPELWAAGVDIVGISDLVTFLENTSDYRRAHREREYGSLALDRDFLASASPLRHADAIRAPLFMIHGRNDPRVPVSETEQLAEKLARKGVRCELVIYEDEGHGLAKLDNQLDAYPRAIAFLDEVLQT